MFRQNPPAPSARYGLSRQCWRRRAATTPSEEEPVAPPRMRRRGRSKVVNGGEAVASSLQRRRCQSYDNLSFSANPISKLAVTPAPTLASETLASVAAAERSIDSAEGFGRRFRRSIRRISKAKVMHVWGIIRHLALS